MIDISVIVPGANVLGEGPLWDIRESRLYWVDGMKGQIWCVAADGSDLCSWELPGVIGSMALREQGGGLLAMENGLHLFDFDSGALTCIGDPEGGDPLVRLNDGKVDRQGRFIVGSLDSGMFGGGDGTRTPQGRLLRVNADFSIEELACGFSVSNGPCWSPDDKSFYFTDTMAGAIYVFDWDTVEGRPHARRTFVTTEEKALPDGATVDSEGFLWSAFNGAFNGIGEVRRFASDGTLDRVVTLPVAKPTSVNFGGPDLDILFVTTMSIEGSLPSRPEDGHLFAIKGLGARGVPEPRFAG